MAAIEKRQSFGFGSSLMPGSRLIPCAILVAVISSGCQSTPPKRSQTVFINRGSETGPAAERAIATARAEVGKWDSGAQIADVRAQRHTKGWFVSVLLSQGVDGAGNPIYPPEPVRNVEINEAGEVTGYHVSN